MCFSTNPLPISRDLQDAVYLATGFVAITKNHDADPLSISGFVSWIGEFANDLIAATADDREYLAGQMRDYVRRNPPNNDPINNAGYVVLLLAFIRNLVDDWASNTLAVVVPLTESRLLDLYQATTDAWAAASVGNYRQMLNSERNLMSGILANHNRFVSQAFGENLMRDVESMIQNLSDLEDRLGNLFDSTASYYPVYASNAMTITRGIASVSQFHKAGYQYGEYVNPLDEKTTDFCWMIAGKRFRVDNAMIQAQQLSSASSVDEYRAIAPYVVKKGNEFQFNGKTLTASNVENVLASANALLPPFHPRCRTLVIPVEG